MQQRRLRQLRTLLQPRQPRPSPLHPRQLLRLRRQLRLRQLRPNQSSIKQPDPILAANHERGEDGVAFFSNETANSIKYEPNQ